MSVSLNINGSTYFYPETGDEGWGPDATDWAVAVTNGLLQKAGGLFQLLAEVDFGTTYGLKSLYYKSRTSNIADAGQLRLAVTDSIAWRDNANAGNLLLAIDGTDQLTFNGVPIQQAAITVSDTTTINLTLAGSDISGIVIDDSLTNAKINSAAGIVYSKLALSNSIVNADINASAAIAYSKLALSNSVVNADIALGAAIAVNKLAALTASRAAVTDGSGFLAAATTTATEIGYVNGVTSSIQTQLNAKVGAVSDTTTIDLTLTTGTLSADIKSDSITNSLINSAAAIAYSKLALTGSIVNADISASAAIAFSKLATLSSANILVGSAGNVATSVAVTGDVTISNAGVTAIGSNKVTNAMLAQVATATFKGRTTASTGNVEDLTATQATALLNNFVGDSGSGGTKGLVPAPASGDAAAGKVLRADGVWAVPAGGGNVTGPASSTTNGFAKFADTSGTLLANSAATVTNSDIAAAAGISVNKLAALTASRAVVSDGSGFISAATTTATEIGYVNGVTSSIQTQLGTKLPTTITTTGDMIYSSSGTTAARLAIGTNGHVLNTLSGIPTWGYYNSVRNVTTTDTPTTSDRVMTTDATGGSFTITLPAASGNTGLAYTFINKTTANVVTIDGNGSETIGGVLNIKFATINDRLAIVCDGTNWQVIDYDVHVYAQYNSNAGQSIPDNTATVMNYEDVVEDRLSLVTIGASWNFAVPFPGTYAVMACNKLNDDGDANESEYFQIEITQGGTSRSNFSVVVQDGIVAGFDAAVTGNILLSCTSSQQIAVNLKHNMGNATPLTTVAIENYITIKRVGN